MRFADLPHLARRLRGAVGARWPSAADQRWVAEQLDAAGSARFFAQDRLDQAHATAVARRVAAAAPQRHDLIRAALLHDIGKADSRLRVPGRIAASLCAMFRLPVTRRMRRYLDHGAIGAEALERSDADPMAVLFARHHHESAAPAGVPAADWEILRRADDE
jgi:putative nucleotidyltransferase with HDIG domain